MTTRFVDSHAHLDAEAFDADRDEVLARARDAGVTDIICIGASEGFESNPRTLDFVRGRDRFYATVGIHPHDARVVTDEVLQRVEALARDPKVVGIGETGLDYYYDQSPRAQQREAFARFLEMAKRLDQPVVVHTRDAEEDTIDILERGPDVRGVIHCFTGTQRLADAAVAMGFHISFSGILTFRSAGALRDVARSLPRDRVLVETDCPYLAPVPHRGKRNEPSFVVRTVQALAALWEESEDEVRRITGENAVSLFGLG